MPGIVVEAETDSSDSRSFPSYRQTLQAHTNRVTKELETLLANCGLEEPWILALRSAAMKHDWGKAHTVFQETMRKHGASTELLAKQCGKAKHSVPHFRHELASALAMMQTGESDLAVYLAASHHGRIRMGIRSMPKEEPTRVRGIRDGDNLPECEVASGVRVPSVSISLEPMLLGSEGLMGAEAGSWTDRMIRLRDDLGPFRLAYLEMLLRTADEKASADPGEER